MENQTPEEKQEVEKKQTLESFKKKVNVAIMLGLVIASCLVTLYITNTLKKDTPVIGEKTAIDIKVIEESIRSIAELNTLTYNYSDVGMFSKQKTLSLFGNETGILGTKKSFIITYDGEMKFGIDLSQISISLKEANGILTVKLPPATMFSHTINEDSIMLLDEKSGLFSSFSVTDYTNFMVEQKEKMENRALESNLLGQAQINAELQIKALIASIPGVTEEYRIRFVD